VSGKRCLDGSERADCGERDTRQLDRAVVEQERDSINLIIHTHLSYPHTTASTTQHGCRVHLLQDHQGYVGSNAASRRCD
jgi:hypothetical protein